MTSVLAAVDATPAAPPEVQELFGATVAALPVDAENAAAEIARRPRHVADRRCQTDTASGAPARRAARGMNAGG